MAEAVNQFVWSDTANHNKHSTTVQARSFLLRSTWAKCKSPQGKMMVRQHVNGKDVMICMFGLLINNSYRW